MTETTPRTEDALSFDITLTSEIAVRLIDKMGGDHMPVAAARASTSGLEAMKYAEPGMEHGNSGLINYLMGQRHGTPSEHSAMTFFLHAPAFVWWEWIRHRVGKSITCPGLSDDMPDASFNLESGRYKVLEPVFWIPRRGPEDDPGPRPQAGPAQVRGGSAPPALRRHASARS
jgi:thymidylate synthase (FAD)